LKKLFKDIVKGGLMTGKTAAIRLGPATLRRPCSVFSGRQGSIIVSPLLWITQRGEGQRHSLEDFSIVGVILCSIGVVALGELAVRPFDVFK
jgi:hypothetical protein